MNRVKLKISFVVVNIISWFSYQSIFENNGLAQMPKIYKYACHFSFLMLMAGAGYLGWRGHKKGWAPKLWLYSYALVIVLMVLSGIVNLSLPGGLPQPVISIPAYLFYFFNTAVPFMVVYVLTIIVREKT